MPRPRPGGRRCASPTSGRANPRHSSILSYTDAPIPGGHGVALFSQRFTDVIRWLLAAAAILLSAAPALAQNRIEIGAAPLTYFDNREHELLRFGKLEFR